MTEAVTQFRRSFKVGKFTVTMRATLVAGKPVSLECAWAPHVPCRLSPVLMKEYRQKRNRVHTALAKELGGPVLMGDEIGFDLISPDGTETAIPLPPAELTTVKTARLNTGKRTFTATFTEYPDRVMFDLRATRYGDFGDTAQLKEWLYPLLKRYDGDPRPLEMHNQHSGETAFIADGGMTIIPPSSLPGSRHA